MTEKTIIAKGANSNRLRLIVFATLIVVVGVLGFCFRDALTLEYLAAQENELRNFQSSNPWLLYGAAFLVYVLVTGMALPGATGMSLAYAWFFGFWPALILISFASTLGAMISFLISRYLLRDSIQNRFGNRLQAVNRNLDSEGAFYLFTMRLIPAIPFFVINLVMGLTSLRTWTFWWVSQLGMLPGTIVYVYAGSSVPGLDEFAKTGIGSIFSPKVIVAFVILGLFPLSVKKIVEFVRKRQSKAG